MLFQVLGQILGQILKSPKKRFLLGMQEPYNQNFNLSGYRDSNPGPPTPEAGALTGLRYTPRQIERKYSNYSLCAKEIFRFILRLSGKRGCDFFLFHLKYWYVVCCCSLPNIEKKVKKRFFS